MFSINYPPVVQQRFCRTKNENGDRISTTEVKFAAFTPAFRERYGRPFDGWLMWGVRIDYTIPNDIKVPKYRMGFEGFARKIKLLRFSNDVDNINALRIAPVSGQEKEAAWCQVVLKKFDDECRKATSTSEDEVREMKSRFCDMVREVIAPETKRYWAKMAQKHPNMDVTDFDMTMEALAFSISITNLLKDPGDEEKGDGVDVDGEEDDDETGVPAWFAEFHRVSRGQGGSREIEDMEAFSHQFFRQGGEEEDDYEGDYGDSWEDEDEEAAEDFDAMDLN